MEPATAAEAAVWPLARLKQHPRQAALFSDLPDAELEELADDIRANGLRQPLEILPDGVILCGHQRARALRLLGRDEAPVLVRHDLAGDDAAERRLIEDNLHRRQLRPLAVARCHVTLKGLNARRPGRTSAKERGDLRDLLARRFGLSGRSLDRWRLALRAPVEVQQALEAERLTLAEAGRVALLPAAEQADIAAAIRAGADPGAACARPSRRGGRGRRVGAARSSFLRLLRRGLDGLRGRLDESPSIGREDHEVLKVAAKVIRRLLRAEVVDRGAEACAARLGDLARGAAGDAAPPKQRGPAPARTRRPAARRASVLGTMGDGGGW